MTIKERKKSLKNLGKFLAQFERDELEVNNSLKNNDLFLDAIQHIIKYAHEQNPWFTEKNIIYALKSWAFALRTDKIDKWLNSYEYNDKSPKNIGVIMAGNIPMVGFHDFISVLMSGNKIIARNSSNDNQLLPLFAKYLIYDNIEFKDYIEFTDEKLNNKVNAVIATGSNNTSRYFEYYFAKYPNIIRKNRNSVAILTGNETDEDMIGLADDIMLYFGLGCRNVSKIFVPRNYDFNKIFKSLLKYKYLINYQKYANNYDYNKAVYLMSTDKYIRNGLLDNGLVLFKEDINYSSPIGTVFYEFYDNIDDVKKILEKDKEKIQAIVSDLGIDNEISFGTTQRPELWDYADGIDTMSFLLDL